VLGTAADAVTVDVRRTINGEGGRAAACAFNDTGLHVFGGSTHSDESSLRSRTIAGARVAE
jgi:hypothetical protein